MAHGLDLSLGFTLLFLTGVWLVNSLIGGWGYLDDGVLFLSHSEKGLYLDLLKDEALWVWFMPNRFYLPLMVLGLLVIEVILVSLHHLLQVFMNNRLLAYLVLIGLAFLLNYLVFQDLILEGQEVF